MTKEKTLLGALAVALFLFLTLSSCNGVTQGLSGTLDVEDFSVEKDQTQLVGGSLTIIASGSADISGTLKANGDTGQSITITAEGDVNVTGTVTAGNGSSGSAGGSLMIVSTNGNIMIAQGSSISAGNGGDGQTTSTAKTITIAEKGSVVLKTIAGGAGAGGGSVTLMALNGDITIADTAGAIRIGNGGNGATITVSGMDLLTTTVPTALENSGGDSGDFTIEASTFNGQVVGTAGEVDLTGTNFLAGGQGGNAGDVFWGMDVDGNSTWPDATTTAKFIVDAKRAGVNLQAALPNLIVPGAPGGDAYFLTPGNGASVRAAGQSATTPGVAGQNARAVGGDGGDCKTPFCTQGGNGGSATARGGDGARGENPDGAGGDGGNANAEGGFRGFGFVTNGFSASASAFGGAGGKGGGQCPDEVVEIGGIGGFGGDAFAFAKIGAAQTTAKGGKGGDGGDGQNFSGPGVDGGGGSTLGGVTTMMVDGAAGTMGTICPPVFELVTAIFATSSEIGTGFHVKRSCIENATLAESEFNCDCAHLHGSITIIGVAGGPFADPDPQGCGHGCIVFVPEDILKITCN